MTKQVQRRRGTATQHTSFTGAEGEISVNTTNKSIHVHDGVTAGGIEGARADLTNVSDSDLNARLTGNTLSSLTITSADINGGTIDGTVIGGTTPAAGNFTTGSFTGNLSFGDNDKAIFGAGSDLQIYSDGTQSFIKESGPGGFYIEGTHIYLNNAAGTASYMTAIDGGAVTLFSAGAAKLATTATGIDVTGNATFGDNDKAIFGAGSDLQIYHTGAHSYIDDTGTGNLYLNSNGAGTIITGAAETQAQFFANGAVNLFYDNSQKLATTSTGIDVTGTVTADGLTVDGTATIGNLYDWTIDDSTLSAGANLSANTTVHFGTTGNNSLNLYTNDTKRLAVGNTGDITFYDGSGNASFVYDESAGSVFNEQGADRDFRVESVNNTHMLFVDAGNNNVGIQLSAPQSALHINENGGPQSSGDMATGLIVSNGTAGTAIQMGTNDASGFGYIKSAYVNSSETGRALLLYTGTAKAVSVESGETVINDDSLDRDFRVESDGNSNMFVVDAGADKVLFGTNGYPNVNVSSPRVYDAVFNNGLSIGDATFTHGFIGTGGTDGNVEIVANSYPANLGSSRQVIISSGTAGGGGPAELARFDSEDGAVFNETSLNRDFRVESDSNTHALFVDAGNNRVGLFTSTPSVALEVLDPVSSNFNGAIHIGDSGSSRRLILEQTDVLTYKMGGTGTNSITQLVAGGSAGIGNVYTSLDQDGLLTHNKGAVFNETGGDSDFRVESDTNANMLFVDAGENTVSIGSGSNTDQGHDLAINKAYGITGQTTKTYTTTIGVGGSATVNVGTFTGSAGNTCSAQLIGGSHYATAQLGTGAAVAVYNLMAVTRLDGTGSVYSSINDVEVGFSAKGIATKPTFEFTSAGVLRVVTAANQGFYGQITVMHHGTFTPA